MKVEQGVAQFLEGNSQIPEGICAILEGNEE